MPSAVGFGDDDGGAMHAGNGMGARGVEYRAVRLTSEGDAFVEERAHVEGEGVGWVRGARSE